MINGNVVSPPAGDVPGYQDVQAMAEAVIEELTRSASLRRRGFGGLFHIINHATGLTELSRFGYRNLANSGLAAHHYHVRLWKSLPDVEDELGPQKAGHDPRTPEYWRSGAESQWSAGDASGENLVWVLFPARVLSRTRRNEREL